MKREASMQIILAAILLLLPVLYVGSYLMVVTPRGTVVENWDGVGTVRIFKYRCGRDLAETFFWPLEQLDRKIRPEAWHYRAREQLKLLESQIKFN